MTIRTAIKEELDITLESTDKLMCENGLYSDDKLIDVKVIDKDNNEFWIGIYNPVTKGFVM